MNNSELPQTTPLSSKPLAELFPTSYVPGPAYVPSKMLDGQPRPKYSEPVMPARPDSLGPDHIHIDVREPSAAQDDISAERVLPMAGSALSSYVDIQPLTDGTPPVNPQ